MVVTYFSDQSSPPTRTASQSKREQKRRPKPKDGSVLICGVCGDRALGYNFDAISCESCKAFFRRNALKYKPFTCSFEGNCKLDAHTRKFCSGCRLKKCFTVGMKKEWILNEDQLVKRRQRQQTRQVHGPSSNNPDIQPCSSTSNDLMGDDNSMPAYLPQGGQCSGAGSHLMPSSTCQNNSNDFMPLTPASYFDSRSSVSPLQKRQYPLSFDGSASPTSTTSPPISYSQKLPSLSGSLQPPSEILPKVPKVEFTSDDEDLYYRPKAVDIHELVGSSDDLSIKEEIVEDKENYTIPLCPEIDSSLRELEKIYTEIFEAPYLPEHLPKLLETPKTANQLFNLTDIFIRRLIRFSKYIPEFKNLSQADQIHILKGGIMEIFYLRSAISFDAKNSGWKFRLQQMSKDNDTPVVEGKIDCSIINNVSNPLFVNHMTFVHQLQELSRKDRFVLMLLFIIDLMYPGRAHLVDVRKVSLCQERHSMWLKAYLESIYTLAEAKVVYKKLLLKLEEVRTLGKESCEMASQLDITNLEPLLVEVFDLNR